MVAIFDLRYCLSEEAEETKEAKITDRTSKDLAPKNCGLQVAPVKKGFHRFLHLVVRRIEMASSNITLFGRGIHHACFFPDCCGFSNLGLFRPSPSTQI